MVVFGHFVLFVDNADFLKHFSTLFLNHFILKLAGISCQEKLSHFEKVILSQNEITFLLQIMLDEINILFRQKKDVFT